VESGSNRMEQGPAVDPTGTGTSSAPSAAAIAVAWSGAAAFVGSLIFFLYAYLVRFAAAPPAGSRLRPVAIDLALFSLFALHHSLLARTPLKARVRQVVPPILERSLYTWIASLLFVLVCWQWQPVPGQLYSLDWPWRGLGYAVQAAGVVAILLGSRALDVLDLAGIRSVMRTRPDQASLVSTGAFGLVRHPLYFGWTLLVAGAPDMTATRALFAVVSAGYCALAIPWEERGLSDVFGEAYDAYRRKVRWRMIPGVY
jgi:protein-S-isoprenylcysteine O-methyltransferase Ste14